MKADYKRRDVKVNGTVVVSVNSVSVEKKPEPTKTPTTSLFNTTKQKKEKIPEIKMEKTSPVPSNPSENKKKVTPERKSPRKNQSNTKQTNAKSIANFFGSKTTSSTADKKASEKSVAAATDKIKTVEIKDDSETNNKSSSKNPHKRSISNTSGKSLQIEKPNQNSKIINIKISIQIQMKKKPKPKRNPIVKCLRKRRLN